jgi:hypothetical protein
VRRDQHRRQHLVQLLRHLVGQVELVGVQRHLLAVQHQVHPAAFGHLADHRHQHPLDLRQRILRRVLDHPVTLAEGPLGVGDPLLQLTLLGAGLLGGQAAALAQVDQLLLQLAPGGLFLLGILVQLLATPAQHALHLLRGGRHPHHVRHAQHADARGRRLSALRHRREFRHRRQVYLHLRSRRLGLFGLLLGLRHDRRRQAGPHRRRGARPGRPVLTGPLAGGGGHEIIVGPAALQRQGRESGGGQRHREPAG